MKKRSIQKVKINTEVIKAKLFEKDYTYSAFSKELGFENSFLSHVLERGEARTAIINIIANGLGCRPEDIIAKDPAPVIETPAVKEASAELTETQQILSELKFLGDEMLQTNKLLLELIEMWRG